MLRDLALSVARLTIVSTVAALAGAPVCGADPEIVLKYPLGPESLRQEGVPEGKITEHVWRDSKVFPRTIRRWWTYVPAQYDESQSAALMVFQDGHAYVRRRGEFRTPVVFDNLIHAGAMPVTIGVFIDPGHKKDELPPKPGWDPRPENRSVE
jgi:enterochelin esterase family protein